MAILKSSPRQANYTASVMTLPYEEPEPDDADPAARSVHFTAAAKGATPAPAPSEVTKAAHPGDVRKMMSQPAKGRKGFNVVRTSHVASRATSGSFAGVRGDDSFHDDMMSGSMQLFMESCCEDDGKERDNMLKPENAATSAATDPYAGYRNAYVASRQEQDEEDASYSTYDSQEDGEGDESDYPDFL